MTRSFCAFSLMVALLGISAASAQEIRLGVELQVNAFTANAQNWPTLAMDGDGDFVVVWQSVGQDGSEYGAFARRFSSVGVPLATEFQVNAHTMGSQYGLSVAAHADGEFVVAWSSEEAGSDFSIFARRFSSDGTPLGDVFQVSTYTAGPQFAPALAVGADGDLVVAWHGYAQDGSSNGIFARQVRRTGELLGAELQVNTYTPNYQRSPAVAMDDDGDFVVAWTSNGQDGSGVGVFAQRFSNSGAPLGVEFQVSSYTASSQRYPSVAAAADGDFVVAWQSSGQDGESYGVFARRFSSAGVPLAGEIQVNVVTESTQSFARVSAEADGDFVVVWRSGIQDGSSLGIFSRLFTSAGVPLDDEFQVNTYTVGVQNIPWVAANDNGGFVVAWQSDGQDGSSYGIFAQRFAKTAILDIDANGATAALSDGVLVLRYLFGFTGSTLVAGAVDTSACNRCDAPDIEAYLATLI